MVKQNFVTFMSPGTFFYEDTTKKIKVWDIKLAILMSKKIKERYGATPYGFYFSTRGRRDNELDSRTIKTGHMYYLGGEILTLDQVKAKNDPKDKILIQNMESNGYKKVIVNTNSYKITLPFYDGDLVLDVQKDGSYEIRDLD